MTQQMQHCTVRMPASLHRALKTYASHLVPEGTEPTVSEAVRTACLEAVQRKVPRRDARATRGVGPEGVPQSKDFGKPEHLRCEGVPRREVRNGSN